MDSNSTRHRNDPRWRSLRAHWSPAPGIAYLNHGSFGLTPDCVRAERRRWLDLVEADPMDFFVRRQEHEFEIVRGHLAQLLGTSASNLALVENATVAMNAVASSVPLQPGDEVLLNDHEYGAVKRIWRRACQRSGAALREVELPFPPESPEQIVAAILAGVTSRTRLVVFSHITSPTALILPAREITHAARERGVAVCVDGPHAIAQIPVDLTALDCDYYTASLHKWLCAPVGSGFLYAHPRAQSQTQPAALSWGKMLPDAPEHWTDEFTWLGTRDPSSYLAVPEAIRFMTDVAGLDDFRAHGHDLAKYAAELISEQFQIPPPVQPDPWHGTMSLAELPPGDAYALREALWRDSRIEVPLSNWQGRRLVRVSAHLYNTAAEIERLALALRRIVSR